MEKIVKKDIYLITNDINDKVYIGQSTNAARRFQQHCKPSADYRDNEYLAKAIQKYGKEHFQLIILETQIENYNEREIYWINYYNSIVPNGYNIQSGGEEPPIMPGYSHPEANLSQEQVEELVKDLRENILTTNQLMKKYGFKSRTSISEFNLGKTYKMDIDYPIRKDVKIGKLTEKDVDSIIELLKTTKYTYKAIGEMYGVEYKAISRIDKGLLHKRITETYPIRSYKWK